MVQHGDFNSWRRLDRRGRVWRGPPVVNIHLIKADPDGSDDLRVAAAPCAAGKICRPRFSLRAACSSHQHRRRFVPLAWLNSTPYGPFIPRLPVVRTTNRSISQKSGAPLTEKQGHYLAFIHTYSYMFGQPPAEADIQRHFRVSPPSDGSSISTASFAVSPAFPGASRFSCLRKLADPHWLGIKTSSRSAKPLARTHHSRAMVRSRSKDGG